MNRTRRLSVVLGLSLLVLALGGGYWLGRRTPAPIEKKRALPLAHAATSPQGNVETSDATPGAGEAIELEPELWAAAGLQIASVVRTPIQEAIRLTGKITLNEDRLSHVFPLVEGRVDEVKVRFGQQVKKGETLVLVQSKEVGEAMLQLYQDRLKLEFAKSRRDWSHDVSRNTLVLIDLMRQRASVAEIETALKDRPMGDYREKLMTAYLMLLKAQAHEQRLSNLSEGGVVAGRQLLEVRSDLNTAQATLQSLLEQISQDALQSSRMADQTVRELETAIAVAETNLAILGFAKRDLQNIDPERQGEELAHYPIVAPFDGVIISKDVVLMERVGPDRQILTIANLSSVWVTADIYETHLQLLPQLGDQPLRVRSEAWPDRVFDARIFYTGDVVQESTRTIALRAIAENPDRMLKPGMFVSVELPSLTTGDVLQVPLSAIQDHEGRSFVFLQTGDQTFERRNVSLGRRGRDSIEIRDGLNENDRIVTSGGFALKSRMLSDLLAE